VGVDASIGVVELDVERVAHGGVCVAHAGDGRVVFVRHAIPGERVVARITEERKSYLRADAVDVLRTSPERVTPPCPWAGPGRCGGCDWQHVGLAEQRRLKAHLVAEQLRRLAGIERDVVVEPVPGDRDGLGWRTRVRFAVDAEGRAGLRRHRSHDIEPIDDCLIAHDGIDASGVLAASWPAVEDLEVEVDRDRTQIVVPYPPGPMDGDVVLEHAAGRDWQVPVGGFWQVHPGAAEVLVDVVASFADVHAGERCLDLYAGVGLFAGALAARTTPRNVTAVESDPRAAAAATRNLPDVNVVTARVERWVRRAQIAADVVVLDPPRKGAGAAVVEAISVAAPRVVCYVACDPAALARDVATFAARGYQLSALRAFDIFPMTAHVECVALLSRA
jgi:tRNA/tmRNA/rRNA uracil-C5-methylase (TrmA/RlmC/RlmD family)